jgi:hypothetical protein
MSDDDFVITAEPAKKIITVSQNTFNVKIALKLYNQLDKLETDGHCVNENSQDLSNDNKDWKWTTRTWSNLINQVASNILQRPAKIDSDCWKVNLDAPNNYPRVELRLAAKKIKKAQSEPNDFCFVQSGNDTPAYKVLQKRSHIRRISSM